MSFWTKSDNKAVVATNEQIIEDLPPLPENARVRAVLTDFKWQQFETGPKHISFKATVVSPADYTNRVLFFKLEPYAEKFGGGEPNHNKRDRAKEQLAVLLTGVGYQSMPEDIEYNDAHLMALDGNMYYLTMGEWVMEDPNSDKPKRGNWLKGVAIANALDSAVRPTAAVKPAQAPAPQATQPAQPAPQVHAPTTQATQPAQTDEEFDDIPF